MNKEARTEMHNGRRDINDVPSECVPFYLLTQRQREVLQHTTDGYTCEEAGQLMGISLRTVGHHRRAIGGIVMEVIGSNFINDYSHQASITILSLIQDGITYGYLAHKLPDEPIQPLSKRETEVVDKVLQGKTYTEIASEDCYAESTISSHMSNVHKKLHTKYYYQAVARVTYLRVHRMWP